LNQFLLYQKCNYLIFFLLSEYPSSIQHWTIDDVKSFLIENKFHCLLSVISEMNGYLLYDLYTMFHTLKNEILLLDKNAQSLTLFIYLRFLSKIKTNDF